MASHGAKESQCDSGCWALVNDAAFCTEEDDAMKKRRQFTPEFVDSLEERALLSRFPIALGPVTTLNFRGNFVLTSRTFEQVQNTINKAFRAFDADFTRAFQRVGGFGPQLDARLGTVAGGLVGEGPGQYGGLLGQIDRIMRRAENRLPFGRGLTGNTGGAGLSTFTAATSFANQSGFAVAEHLDIDLNSGNGLVATSPTPNLNSARNAIETVRQATLSIVGVPDFQKPGLLPFYIQLFGPQGLSGARVFGLKNT
jgi:hypothetical protein